MKSSTKIALGLGAGLVLLADFYRRSRQLDAAIAAGQTQPDGIHNYLATLYWPRSWAA